MRLLHDIALDRPDSTKFKLQFFGRMPTNEDWSQLLPGGEEEETQAAPGALG